MRKFWRPGKQSNKFISTSNVSNPLKHIKCDIADHLSCFRGSQLDAKIYIITTLIASGQTSQSSHQVCQNYFSLYQGFISGSFSDFGDQFYVLMIQFLSTYLLGTYTFKMAINPEYKIPEISFENNAALCNLHYNEVYASIHNCSHIRP